ncbi:GNAT family N-acetyltransferase [Candidatus Woesearchaeota archaeon]|nr:GNAT family N-acetyltransferase [Candidatus Woesearchaeota archaeon]
MTLDYKIRKYESRDRDAVRSICADTGFLGNPINPIFSDRELFADMIIDYYLRKEPEHTSVAEMGGQVIGYVTGSMYQFTHLGLALDGVGPIVQAVSRQLTGKYREHPQNKGFIKWLFLCAPLEMVNHPERSAHYHFNLQEGYRGIGLGTEMLSQFEEEVKRTGLSRVYGEVFAHPQKPLDYFRDAGWEIYDKKPTTLFRDLVEEEVFLACITRKIKS